MRSLSRPVALGLMFLVTCALYAGTYSFRSITDTDLNSYQTRALALHGDVELTRYQPKIDPNAMWVDWHAHRYSIYGVGVSLPAVPIYMVFARLGAPDRVLQELAAVPFVAAVVVLMFILLARMAPSRYAAAGAIIFAFGTTLWPLASMAFFQNGATLIGETIGLLGLFSTTRRQSFWAGIGFGYAAFVRPQTGILLVVTGVFYLVRDRRALLWFIGGAAIPLAATVIQNRWIWGSWLSGGYLHSPVGFHGDPRHTVWALLFGWWRGIFVYSPVLLLGLFGLGLALVRPRAWLESRLIVLGIGVIGMVLFYAGFTTWYGGLAQFGYRYLIDVVPLLIVLSVFALQRLPVIRGLAILAGGLSVVTMTFGSAPNNFAFDGNMFATRFVDASIGQAWIVAVRSPLATSLRLAAVGLVCLTIYKLSFAASLDGVPAALDRAPTS